MALRALLFPRSMPHNSGSKKAKYGFGILQGYYPTQTHSSIIPWGRTWKANDVTHRVFSN